MDFNSLIAFENDFSPMFVVPNVAFFLRAHSLGYPAQVNSIHLCKALFFVQALCDAQRCHE